MKVQPGYAYEVSVIVVSFNTRDLLRECLQSIVSECERLPEGKTAEVLVVDNASKDDSAGMVEEEFCGFAPGSKATVKLIRSEVNLGFGAANNLALEQCGGRYPVLLNSDAFFHEGCLNRAIEYMDRQPEVGIGGARLVSRNGGWQPSSRLFHTIWNDTIVLTGLSAKFAKSKIFGAPDRTWASPDEPCATDWVPGAFLILRREAMERVGLFDPTFFLYYEEVDLCLRVKQAGYQVFYWPDVVVTHIGGESSRKMTNLKFSTASSQIELWRMRSTFLYYRKHHGAQTRLARWLEEGLYTLRVWRNRYSKAPGRRERGEDAVQLRALLRQAWRETRGGRVSPERPW